MLVSQLLLDTLEDLRRQEFEKFQWYLSMEILKPLKPIPPARLEEASREKTISIMLRSYMEEPTVNVTVQILKMMQVNSLAEELRSRYAELKTASSSTSSSTAAPPPPAAPSAAAPPAAAPPAASPPADAPPPVMSAQNGGVVFAPSFNSSTFGSCSFTINK